MKLFKPISKPIFKHNYFKLLKQKQSFGLGDTKFIYNFCNK